MYLGLYGRSPLTHITLSLTLGFRPDPKFFYAFVLSKTLECRPLQYADTMEILFFKTLRSHSATFEIIRCDELTGVKKSTVPI